MSEDNAYKPGDIVWVKLNNVWWPGEVTAMDGELLKDTRKKPYCMVKFFNEDFVEFVKTSKQIFPFQCARKADLLKKGMDLFKAKNKFMEKFPDDVKLAERLCPASRRSTDTIIINDRPDSIVKAVMGESVAHLMSDYVEEPSRRSHRPSMDSVTKIMNITPRLKTPPLQQGHNKGSAGVAANAAASTPTQPSSSTPKMLSATYTPPSSSNQNAMVYRCPSCNFQTSRLNVSIMHRKMHSGGPSPAVSTPPSRPSPATKTPSVATPPATSASVEQKAPATTTARQRKAAEAAAPPPKPAETKKTLVEVPPTKGRPSSVLASKKQESGGEKLKRNAKKSEARSNGQSAAAAVATTPTSTRPPLQKTDSEEIRKRLLADWSDEDEEKEKDEKVTKKARGSKGEEEAPPKSPAADRSLNEPEAPPGGGEAERSSPTIANNNNLDSQEAAKEATPPKSRSIRNIPKKDRRALKEFNADGEAAETGPAVAPSVEEVVAVVAATTTTATTSEEVPTPTEEATEPPKDPEEAEAKCNDSGEKSAEDPAGGEEEAKVMDNGGEGEPEAVPLSDCFDFPDEEENESDVLTSIANFKKKYLSPEKASAEKRASVEEAPGEAEGEADSPEKPKVEETKDLELAAEIDSLLEQTSGTVHEVSAVSVKTLPIKERGKRIFKSRNKSKMDDEDVAEDTPATVTTSVEADCTERVASLLEGGEDEKAPEAESVTPPTNGENKENLGLSTEEEVVPPEVTEALEKPDKEAERLKDSEVVIRDSPVTVLNSEEIRNGHSRSPTEETSSVGISEAGAEFGSPASMLDEERFPRSRLGGATPIMKERSTTPRKEKSPVSEDKDLVESSTKEKEPGSEFGEDPEEISLGPEVEDDEDEIESPPHEELSNHPLDSKKQKLIDNVEEEDEEEDEEIESPPCEALSGNELEEELNKARLAKAKFGRKSKSPRTIGTNSSSATPTPSPTSTMAEDSQSSLSLRRSGRKAKASSSSPNLVSTSGEDKDGVEHLEREEPHTNYIESQAEGDVEEDKDSELKPKEEKKEAQKSEDAASKDLPSPRDVTSQSPVEDKSPEEGSSSPGRTRRATRRSPTEAKASESLPPKRSRRSLKSPAEEATPSKESENCVEIVFTEDQASQEPQVIPIEAQLDTEDETSQGSSSFLLNAIELVEGEESCVDGAEQGDEAVEHQAGKKTPAPNGRPKSATKKEKTPLRRKILDSEAASATTPKVRRTVEGKAKLVSPERTEAEAKEDGVPTEESKAAKGPSPKQQKDAKTTSPAGSQQRPARPPKKEMSFSISKRRTALPSLVPRKKSLSQDAAVIILDSPTKDEAPLLIDSIDSAAAAAEEPTTINSTIITTSAGMFDINDIPMVLSNDEELLSTSGTTSTAFASDAGAEGPQIIKQQILQPAHSPVPPKRPKSSAELAASPTPPDSKQLSVDSRGNKYFIVKTEAATTPAAGGKVKSPGAAVTGGRKQAGNTIALPGHQQRSPKDAQRSPGSLQRHVAAAKVAKMAPGDSAAQELPSTSKAAQSLITSEGPHPILNRKMKTQPPQNRGTRSPSQGATALRKPQVASSEQAAEEPQIVGATPPQAVHSTTYSEEQLGQMQTDDQLEAASKILAVPTQPIPGYSETFLLCTLVNNSYRPIDNVPLYLDHDLNQLVPVPLDALDGQPHLIVDHPPPEEDDDVVVGQLTMSTTAAVPGASQQQQQQLVLPAGGVSLDTVEADSSTQFLCGGGASAAAVASSASEDGEDVSQSLPAAPAGGADDSTGGENSLEAPHELGSLGGDAEADPDADEGPNEIVPSNALILNIEGQQIIMDSSTIAHLLANPDANTQLVTDDGTEFVLTREVLAALEAQQSANLEAAGSGDEVAAPADILAVALAGSNLYGSDVLQIETSQHLPLLGADGSIVFPAAAAAALGAAHLTPPITAHTSETNAVLNPIMSTLESPSTSVAGGGGVSTTATTAALLATSVAAGLPPHQRPNLEDSLAVIGVTAPSSSVPISLELPITVTNPAIAPPKTLLPPPPTDIEQFQSSSSVAELTAAAAAAINEAAAVFAADSHS